MRSIQSPTAAGQVNSFEVWLSKIWDYLDKIRMKVGFNWLLLLLFCTKPSVYL